MRVSCNETDPMMHGRPTPSRGFGCAGRAVPPPCRRRGEGERRSVATDKFLALFLAEHASGTKENVCNDKPLHGSG